MLGFEVCTPQRDMKDKQVTVLQYFEAVAKSAKKKKRWKMASALYPTIQAAPMLLGSRLTNGLDAKQSLR